MKYWGRENETWKKERVSDSSGKAARETERWDSLDRDSVEI